ncbi:MAG: hypothetical protein R3D03_15235 [Geminicoccaceae bacterium]
MTALVRMPEPRRTAMLAALFHSLEAIAQDDAIELFEGLANEVERSGQGLQHGTHAQPA